MMKSDWREHSNDVVVIRLSGWKVMKSMIAGIIGIILILSLMTFSYFIAKNGSEIGWLLFALWGIVLLILLWGIFRIIRQVLEFKKRYIRLDREGLFYSAENQLILWNEIKDIAVRKYKRMIWVDLYFESSGTGAKKLLRLHDGFKLSEYLKMFDARS